MIGFRRKVEAGEYMKRHFNELSPAEAERLALLSEEMGEAVQSIGKILRHGYENYNPHEATPSNRKQLETELGDVMAAMKLMYESGDIKKDAVKDRKRKKLEKVVMYLHHNQPPFGGKKNEADRDRG